jgi:hypothetical protein
MALRVLDGNQTATTLSSVVTGGEHIVAHSVVSLGANAIANIASAVSGSVVSISNFPSTQPISGTVTANGGDFAYSESQDIGNIADKGILIGYEDDISTQFRRVSDAQPLPVTINSAGNIPVISGTVTVGNSVTIGSLPTLAPQLPRVTFIDGSGSVTTANSAITVFASSTTRSYLLVQVTTGSAFVNVGATATTVNGINLTAGQGYAWETTIPQGLVSLISTTTSSRWVAKEA